MREEMSFHMLPSLRTFSPLPHLPSPPHSSQPYPCFPLSFHSAWLVSQPSYLRLSRHPPNFSLPQAVATACSLHPLTPAKTWLGTWGPTRSVGHFSERWVLGGEGLFSAASPLGIPY